MVSPIESGQPVINPLTVELQAELGFEYDATREWLSNDQFSSISSSVVNEHLPANVRISSSGERYQMGARRVDLDGFLKLASLINPEAQGIDAVVNFWNDVEEVKISADDEFIYMETGIEPTAEGFETRYQILHSAWDAALSAAAKNFTYQQMMEDAWHGLTIKKVLGTTGNTMQSRTVLFGRSFFDDIDDRRKELDEMPAEAFWIDTGSMAPNLREYPIGLGKHGLDKISGSLKYMGMDRNVDHNSHQITIRVKHDTNGNFAEIYNYNNNYNWDTREWARNNSLKLRLLASEGEEFNIVDDFSKVKKAVLVDCEDGTEIDYDIDVAVSDHSVSIESSDGEVVLELEEPCCNECKVPYWKFPNQRYVEKSQGVDFKTVNSYVLGHDQNGLDRYFFPQQNSEREGVYCAHCIPQQVEEYLEIHPYAHEETAREIFTKRLNEAGYNNAKIWQPSWGHYRGEWVAEVYTEYERDNRKIMRVLGRASLTDDGKFKPMLMPVEAANFRA